MPRKVNQGELKLTRRLSEVSAKQFLGDRPPAATELLRRAVETDPEVASLLSRHPRNVDDAILLVRLRE